MTALAGAAQPATWTCRSPFCDRTLDRPTGHAQGYCGACAQRWYRAGKLPEGPPPPQEGPRRGPASRRAVAARRERLAELRAQGMSIHEAARELGISVNTAEKDAKVIAARARTVADGTWEEAVMPRILPVPSGADRWWQQTACRGMPLDLFYGHDREPHSPVREAAAKAVCARCPVRRECLDDAIRLHDWHGIKGGLDGDERKAEHQRRQKRARREVAA